MSPEKSFIMQSKVKGQGRESQKHGWRGFMHSFECWFLLAASALSATDRLTEIVA